MKSSIMVKEMLCVIYISNNLPFLGLSIFDKHIDGIKYPVFLAFGALFSLEFSLKRLRQRIKSNGIFRFYTLLSVRMTLLFCTSHLWTLVLKQSMHLIEEVNVPNSLPSQHLWHWHWKNHSFMKVVWREVKPYMKNITE